MVAVNLKGDAMTDNLQKRPTCNRISILALGTAALLGATALAVPSSASAFGFGGHFGGGFANHAFGARSFHSFASHSFANARPFRRMPEGRGVHGPDDVPRSPGPLAEGPKWFSVTTPCGTNWYTRGGLFTWQYVYSVYRCQ